MVWAGVIVNSGSSCLNAARAPSTSTLLTVSEPKSRLKLESSSVAVAVMTLMP
jgi:hypothetical protein